MLLGNNRVTFTRLQSGLSISRYIWFSEPPCTAAAVEFRCVMSATYDHDVKLATDSVDAMTLGNGEEGEAPPSPKYTPAAPVLPVSNKIGHCQQYVFAETECTI